MSSIHAIRWIENLNDAGHELYWFDIADNGGFETKLNVTKLTNWKLRKLPYLKGEYYLYKNHYSLYKLIQRFLETSISECFEKLVVEIQPDLVHSFEMHSCSIPILKTMEKYPDIKWLYNCWGNDIYYYRNFKIFEKNISRFLKRVNYFVTDCERDVNLVLKYDFNCKFLGTLPTGGGYDLEYYSKFKMRYENRNIILVKGYNHHLGRGLNIVKALQKLDEKLQNFEIIIFGAHVNVKKYVENNKLSFTVLDGKQTEHEQLLKFFGKALLYIGNSISDGMPNTLLEAIIMGAFPIQSNPGGATSEIIKNKVNGLLIENPEDCDEIKNHIEYALNNIDMVKSGNKLNEQIALERLGYQVNNAKIKDIYEQISKD